MIEFSPSGELASITVPMEKQYLMEFQKECLTNLNMSPEEVVRALIHQVLSQAQKRSDA